MQNIRSRPGKVTEKWQTFHTEGLHRKDRLCGIHEETRTICTILVRKSQRKRQFKTPRCKWKNNVEVRVSEVAVSCELDWTG